MILCTLLWKSLHNLSMNYGLFVLKVYSNCPCFSSICNFTLSTFMFSHLVKSYYHQYRKLHRVYIIHGSSKCKLTHFLIKDQEKCPIWEQTGLVILWEYSKKECTHTFVAHKWVDKWEWDSGGILVLWTCLSPWGGWGRSRDRGCFCLLVICLVF